MEIIPGQLQVISSENSIISEGPLWDARKKILYFLDIDGKKLHCIDWNTGSHRVHYLPQRTGFIALKQNGDIIFGMEDGIYEEDDSEKFIMINDKAEISGQRFNDGKVGPDGGIFAGTISRGGDGKLYYMGKGKKLHTILENIKVSNGLDWSIDEKILYYCDTPTGRIDAFDYDKHTAIISNRRTAIEIPKEMGSPDGLTIDTEGMLWIALWKGARVVRANPETGKLMAEVPLPASLVTCPIFAGENLDELVITTASLNIDLDKEPFAGNVFKIKLPYRGRKAYRYDRD